MLKIKNILFGILIFALVLGSIAGIVSAENNTNITNDNSGDNNINDNGSNDFDNMNVNWLMFQGNQFHTGFLKEDGIMFLMFGYLVLEVLLNLFHV